MNKTENLSVMLEDSTSSKSENSIPSSNFWNNLPYPALITVYKFLNNHDRLSAGLACHHWLIAFESPTLWKEMHFVFDDDMILDSRKAVQFVEKYASAVKYLKLTFRRRHLTPPKEAIENIRMFFECLSSCSQLYSLVLENFLLSLENCSATHLSQMMDAFKYFAKSQRHLQKATFLNTLFSQKDGLEIFAEIANHNKSLTSLGMTYFFEETVIIFSHPEFQNSVKCLSNVKVWEISYQCIDAGILDLFCAEDHSGLDRLTINCNFVENLHHTIPNESWKKLRRRHPNVVVNFEIVEVVTYQKFVLFLPAATQLHALCYRCGFSLQTVERLRIHGVSILHYLRSTFGNFLCKIRLDFGFVRIPSLEQAILNLFKTCKVLEEATLTGVLQVHVASRICEMALREESALKDIYLVFYFTCIENIEDMRRLLEYQRMLKNKGVNFHFNLLSSQLNV